MQCQVSDIFSEEGRGLSPAAPSPSLAGHICANCPAPGPVAAGIHERLKDIYRRQQELAE
jgi:hypothetical protein